MEKSVLIVHGDVGRACAHTARGLSEGMLATQFYLLRSNFDNQG